MLRTTVVRLDNIGLAGDAELAAGLGDLAVADGHFFVAGGGAAIGLFAAAAGRRLDRAALAGTARLVSTETTLSATWTKPPST